MPRYWGFDDMQALISSSESAGECYQLGLRAYHRGDYESAFSLLESAIHADCWERQYYIELCEMYRAEGRLDDALRVGLHASALWPDCERVGCALGFLFYDRNELDEAILSFRKVIEYDSDCIRAHIGLGVSLLTAGLWIEGWQEFSWRVRLFPYAGIVSRIPRWDGSNAFGKTLLLIGEGFGDTIQFIRYIPQVASLCDKLIIFCRPELQSMLTRLYGSAAVSIVPNWCVLPDCDLYCLLMDAAGLLHDEQPTNKAVPYISARDTLVEFWCQHLGPPKKLRVGIAWQGDPANFNNFRRSIAWNYLEPLANISDVEFIGLQKNVGQVSIVNLGPQLNDFEDTAALLESVDLVITIESAIAHLAGAMGKPVWTLLPYAAGWRWLTKGNSSYWYPSMRLFRQSRPGDWGSVIADVTMELNVILSDRKESQPEW